ncbi:hypothetical protein Poli38472_009254 [Pythium oligandrum]|uniref:Uncharacterized protein n=1 Tax=Pythium oligandrum TaxID=41045 RepID=A0A8K1FMP9_PYTOL|nr:hypothetical protein Poli38472_009254 [Pythium oligandrum]|eukprot:TMW65087.1 hypothetical protein Poli38472_009254 [Pythium oligandrum]
MVTTATVTSPTRGKGEMEPCATDAHERVHSTVRLNRFTLQFEDATLEKAYQAFIHRRKKALWLRSLVPAAAFHILFGLGDCLEHPPEYLLVTIPARVFLSMLQVSMFVLVRWDLIRASESTMLLVCICNGIPTLLLYALQRPSLHQWDALFVVFGLSFYTIPKITPLGFVASLLGSWATALLYAALSVLVRPPPHSIESLLGFLYCAPAIGIFNTISYFSEYNSRERFVLRRRLRSESITLAVSRTSTLPPAVTTEHTDRFFQSILNTNNGKFLFGVALWGAFTIGGWASLPDMLKFVDEETGWAWFSHCAGLTMFLVFMTRQLQWLFVVPVFGAVVLWMMTLTMPPHWIIISAHSVGYGLLLASIVVAMGVFSRFVCVWRELVSFLTRSIFLYPQLRAGLNEEYPLLVKIVSEYTAGLDPEIMNSRDSTNDAIVKSTAAASSVVMVPASSIEMKRASSQRTSPRQRHSTAKRSANRDPTSLAVAKTTLDKVLEEPKPEPCTAAEEHKMVSVLPSFKAGKCFFCSKNEAEHLVPACGMWGKWTHWRMSQQQDIMYGSLALPGSNTSGNSSAGSRALMGKPVTAMCTSYYDVQEQKSELEQRLTALETENAQLREELELWKQKEAKAIAASVQTQSELRVVHEKHSQEMQRLEVSLQHKMEEAITASNHTTHEHKRQLRETEALNKKLNGQLQAARRQTDKLQQELSAVQKTQATHTKLLTERTDEVAALSEQVEVLQKELAAARRGTSAETSVHGWIEATLSPSSSTVSSVSSPATAQSSITALQPSRRLPYARWLEIEGLRESVSKPDVASCYRPWSLDSFKTT